MQSLLADKRLLICVLRLTLNENGILAYGEVVRLDGSRVGLFHEWRALPQLLESWSARQDEEDRWNNPPDPS